MPTIPTKLDITSVKNKVMIVFYKSLQNYNIADKEKTNPIEESIILKMADDWEKNEEEIAKTRLTSATPPTILTDSLKESCSLLFTEEILEFCSKHNIYHECCKYHSLFIECFNHIQKIDISISEDPEIPDYRHVCFIITIADSIENILKSEDDFRDKLDKEVSPDKRKFFVYNYSIV